MGLRYEVYSLPWDAGGFKKKFFYLPVEEGSGRGTVEFLTTNGDGSVDVLLDGLEAANRSLDEIVSDTTSSLIRVIDCLPDGTNTIIDEWVCERPARNHDDNRIATISGPKLKAKIFDGQTFPTQDGLNPTKNPDHIFGGDNILQNPGFEDIDTQSSIFRLLIDATAGTFTLSIGSGNTDPIPYNPHDGSLEAAIEDAVTGIADDVSVTPLDGQVDVYKLSITAESGTFTLSDGVDDTSAIAFNASAATIETRIIADIASINDVDVVLVNDPDGDYFTIEFIDPVAGTLQIDTTNLDDGSASLSPARTSGGFEIEFVTPAIANLTVNPSGLTGDASVVSIQEGQEEPSGWTISQQISFGTPRPYGTYDAFQVSTAQAHSGDSSLFIDPANITSFLDVYAGAQQVIGVEPGQLHQASIWVFPTAPGQTYRLVIRGIDEDLISKPLAAGNISPPANVWTQIVLKDIQVEEDSQVIFRFANIDQTGNPAGFYVDDAYLAPGFAANTWGHIVNYFLDLKTTEFDWVDYSSITTALDSGGVPWPRVESVTGYFGESYGQFWDKGIDLEYEWDLRPKAAPVGSLTHDLVWHVTGGMDDAPSTGIYPNASVTGGDSLTRTPAYTKVRIEGSDGVFVEVEDAGAVASFGPLEKHIRDTSLHSVESLTARANALLAYESANRNATHFQMVEHATLPRPGTHFRVGDTVPMQLPPGLAKTSKRVQSFSYTNTFPTQYLVTGSRVYEGEAAAYSLLWRLWRRFAIPIRPKKAGAIPFAGGGSHIDVAASDAPQWEKDAARYLAVGVDDQIIIQAVRNEMTSVTAGLFEGTRLQLSSGVFQINMDAVAFGGIEFPDGLLQGMGNSATILSAGNTSGSVHDNPIVHFQGPHCSIRDLSLEGGSGNRVTGLQTDDYNAFIENVHFDTNGKAMILDGNSIRVIGNLILGEDGIVVAANTTGVVIVGNEYDGSGIPIVYGGSNDPIRVVGNIGIPDLDSAATAASVTSDLSQPNALSVGQGVSKLPFSLAAEIVSVLLAVGTSPTGADLIVDINKNGTTVFTTQANRPTIPAGDANGVGAETVPDVTAIAEGDYLTVDIDQIGSTIPGSDLTVVVEWRPV